MITEYENPLSKRLKAARLLAGMSQAKLGILAGIDINSASARMNQYETGKHEPNYRTMQRIARALSVPTGYFYTEEDDIADLILQARSNNT